MSKELAIKRSIENVRLFFTESQKADLRREVVDALNKVTDLNESLKSHVERVKAEIKPINLIINQKLKAVKAGYEDVDMEVYLVPDYDRKIMQFMDENDEVIGERRMTHAEYQTQISMI